MPRGAPLRTPGSHRLGVPVGRRSPPEFLAPSPVGVIQHLVAPAGCPALPHSGLPWRHRPGEPPASRADKREGGDEARDGRSGTRWTPPVAPVCPVLAPIRPGPPSTRRGPRDGRNRPLEWPELLRPPWERAPPLNPASSELRRYGLGQPPG